MGLPSRRCPDRDDRSIGAGARGARDARDAIAPPTDGDSRTVPPPGPDRDGGVILFGAVGAGVGAVVGASVGAHLRHSLEHAQCCSSAIESLRSGSRTPILNYDGRERDAELERDPAYLAARSRELAAGISDGDGVDLDAEVLAAFALDASGEDALLPSTLRRELAFAAHHATHHFFVAGLVAKSHLGVALPDDVGRAPATLRHDRQASSTGAYVDVGG